jgi:acetoin utilization deacetylase AcuC-like enzyme
MQGDRDVMVLYDERMLDHRPDFEKPFLPGRLDRRIRDYCTAAGVHLAYPEHPGRLTCIRERLENTPIPGVRLVDGRAATREELARVHTASHLDAIDELRGQDAWLDVDTTAVSPGSVEAATVAAGTSIAAAEAAVTGDTDAAFAIVRPPGHHAESVRSRGFCLFNNVAVAAAHARSKLGCERVLIVDWDAHHGNGTQEIFWTDPDVMVFDVHRAAPFYPGSGALYEIGAGLGEGATVNVPLPGGSGDAALMKALTDVLVPAADYFQPDLVLVSAGFDPHRLDLALNATYEGFGAMTGIVQDVAAKHCGGRLALILEGGYNAESLPGGVHAVLSVLAGGDVPVPRECGLAEVEEAARYHASAFRAYDPPAEEGPGR